QRECASWVSFYHYKRNRQNSATFSPPVGSQVEPSSYEFEEGPSKKILVFEVRHWISNHEAGIGEPKAGNTVGTTFYGSQGYLSMWDGRRYFQEEDGIRAWSVTGVQTCALPI